MVWPFFFYFLMFSGMVFFTPYLVLLYRDLGFTGGQIGALVGITPLFTMFGATLWTGLADTTRRHRLVMGVCLLGTITSLLVFPSLRLFAPVLAGAVLISLFFSPVSPFVDSATMHMLSDRKYMYGRIRVGGTIGFGVAAPIAGLLVDRFDLKIVFWGAAALFLAALLISPQLSYSIREDNPDPVPIPIRRLLQDSRWIGFLILAFVGGVALASNVSFFYPFLQELGMADSMMGVAFGLGAIGEIPILFFGNRLLKRFPAYTLLLLGMAAVGLRQLLFAATTSPALIFVNQLIVNGLAFPVMWLAGVAYADELSPAGMKSTGQGLFAAMVFGFGQAVGGLIGGPMYESIGGRGLNLVYGIVVMVTTGLVILVTQLGKKKPGFAV